MHKKNKVKIKQTNKKKVPLEPLVLSCGTDSHRLHLPVTKRRNLGISFFLSAVNRYNVSYHSFDANMFSEQEKKSGMGCQGVN